MVMAIWRKDEKLYTRLQDLMRTYLMHDHTPNIDKQLQEQFDSYFKWHEEHWERGGIDSFGGQTGSQLNRYILAGKLALSIPNLLPGNYKWMRPGRAATLLQLLRETAFDSELFYKTPISKINTYY